MKKLLQLAAVGFAFVAFSPSSSARTGSEDSSVEPLACKPRGSSCHTSFECCSQNCQAVNGKDTCH